MCKRVKPTLRERFRRLTASRADSPLKNLRLVTSSVATVRAAEAP